MNNKDFAINYINRSCEADLDFKKNVEILDKYDFSDYISEGLNLWALRDKIENDFDKKVKAEYGVYIFDYLNSEDTCMYFASRYNVWFQEYTDWVVRHENGTYEPTRKRVKDD